MKKTVLAGLLACLLLLSACAPAPAVEGEKTLQILATTYPVYLLATAVTEGAQGVEVSLLVNQQTACLHDYTITVTDMKALERADVILMNGLGLEDFMADALKSSDAAVIDCSAGVETLILPDGETDPHIWMDPYKADQMMETIALALQELTGDEGYHSRYLTERENLAAAGARWRQALSGLEQAPLITFHDGFQYFAAYLDLNLLKAIEEEEGAETSAAEIKEIVGLIEAHRIPALFTERNGSDATAKAIARETGVAVYPLDMIMSGEGRGLTPYLDAMQANIDTLTEALG